MQSIFEGRPSESPFIEMIWRVRIGPDYFAVCPADIRWNMLFMRWNDDVRVTVEGPTTQHVSKTQPEGSEFLVVKFALGVFMPYIPIKQVLNTDALLPEAGHRQRFWLDGTSWEFPDYENVETFVERLVREEVLLIDPLVSAVLDEEDHEMSFRTVRRRFQHATGLTQSAIQQIERAKQAVALLEQGVSILDAVHLAGYADQPHMTRALRRFFGQTPAQIAQIALLA